MLSAERVKLLGSCKVDASERHGDLRTGERERGRRGASDLRRIARIVVGNDGGRRTVCCRGPQAILGNCSLRVEMQHTQWIEIQDPMEMEKL